MNKINHLKETHIHILIMLFLVTSISCGKVGGKMARKITPKISSKKAQKIADEIQSKPGKNLNSKNVPEKIKYLINHAKMEVIEGVTEFYVFNGLDLEDLSNERKRDYEGLYFLDYSEEDLSMNTTARDFIYVSSEDDHLHYLEQLTNNKSEEHIFKRVVFSPIIAYDDRAKENKVDTTIGEVSHYTLTHLDSSNLRFQYHEIYKIADSLIEHTCAESYELKEGDISKIKNIVPITIHLAEEHFTSRLRCYRDYWLRASFLELKKDLVNLISTDTEAYDFLENCRHCSIQIRLKMHFLDTPKIESKFSLKAIEFNTSFKPLKYSIGHQILIIDNGYVAD